MKFLFTPLFVALVVMFNFCFSQNTNNNIHISSKNDTAWKTQYRATAEKAFSLVHTFVQAKPNFKNSTLEARAIVTLSPYAYNQTLLALDAKAMDIKNVSLVGKKQDNLSMIYAQSDDKLNITFNKAISPTDTLSILIDYIAQPELHDGEVSTAITDAKGVYFINPDKTNAYKKTQIWTQGEIESTSVWCPTIDKPNQKSTFALKLIVPEHYQTLSNGLLIRQYDTLKDYRVDLWKISDPIPPYLFFFTVGEYEIIKDNDYKGREISYYVEKEYAHLAKKIFGATPEIIKCYEDLLGTEYVWEKLSQVVVEDYVSGAMENATSILHQKTALQDAGDLVDENIWEGVIAHEIAHHWFGNLVTIESWSNLTLNESFADYLEYLWLECKYGQDIAKKHAYDNLKTYLNSPVAFTKNLVRHHYKQSGDMFDVVSYIKGGLILHMLRDYLGDKVFFDGLKAYLNKYKFGTAEADDLRLTFEEISGKDLNWFFDQWYFSNGHPNLDVRYKYNDENNLSSVYIHQSQENIFKIPLKIAFVYLDTIKIEEVMLQSAYDTFNFYTDTRPNLINIDPDNVLICSKKENKSLKTYLFQYKHAQNIIQKLEAINAINSQKEEDEVAIQILTLALEDKLNDVKITALDRLNPKVKHFENSYLKKVEALAKDKSSLVRSAALEVLANYNGQKYLPYFLNGLNDSSNAVRVTSLNALQGIDEYNAVKYARKLARDIKEKKIYTASAGIIYKQYEKKDWDILRNAYAKYTLYEKYTLIEPFVEYLKNIHDPKIVDEGTQILLDDWANIPPGYKFLQVVYASLIASIWEEYKKDKKYSNTVKAIRKKLNI